MPCSVNLSDRKGGGEKNFLLKKNSRPGVTPELRRPEEPHKETVGEKGGEKEGGRERGREEGLLLV